MFWDRFIPFSFADVQQLVGMNSRVSLAVMLICLLLSDAVLGAGWQGTGSGMNSTVIAEIWKDLQTNVDSAAMANKYNDFTKEISDRLNSKWNEAWNVVSNKCKAQYDTILYGYAFRNQWMWYNGVTTPYVPSNETLTLIVWKDYNCKDWKSIPLYQSYTRSTFPSTMKSTIKAQAQMINPNKLANDIWGAAHTMMSNILANSEFLTGGYTIIMSQDGFNSKFQGYVCRVGDRHYNYYYENLATLYNTLGNFYLFQTRQPLP